MTASETPSEQFDLATVIKLSQAVSSEIFLDKLVDRLLAPRSHSRAPGEAC
jgi:hypothetical protein